MTPKIFSKLLGLFVLLLACYSLVMALILHLLAWRATGGMLHLLLMEVLCSAVVALVIAIPAAAWIARRFSLRIDRVIAFARRIAQGDLSARLSPEGKDEFSTMELSLNRTVDCLG
jgi:two-component system phosphate regulon sensor histidine kinase PhoR